MKTVACDWDDTLVDASSQLFLPDAVDALRWLNTNTKLLIHTCRASYPAGEQMVRDGLRRAFAPVVADGIVIVGKPDADVYVDNLAAPYRGDWGRVLDEIAQAAR